MAAARGRRPWLKAIRESKDPGLFTVVFEDAAAMLGLLVALIGIFLAQTLDLPVLDGVASILIGVILAMTACLLAYECKALLIGEAALPETREAIRAAIAADPAIAKINEILTMHMGAKDILLTASLDFRDSLSAAEVEIAVARLEQQIKTDHPAVKRVFFEAQSWRAHLEAQKTL